MTRYENICLDLQQSNRSPTRWHGKEMWVFLKPKHEEFGFLDHMHKRFLKRWDLRCYTSKSTIKINFWLHNSILCNHQFFFRNLHIGRYTCISNIILPLYKKEAGRRNLPIIVWCLQIHAVKLILFYFFNV